MYISHYVEFMFILHAVRKTHPEQKRPDIHRRRYGWNSGGRMASAEGGLMQSGVGYWDLPSRADQRVWGSVLSSLVGSGAQPRSKTDFGVF